MLPVIGFTTAWKLFWALGTLVATVANVLVLRRRSVPAGRATVALGAAAGVAFVGARLEWVIENGVPLRELLTVPGARMPGGFVALAVFLPAFLRTLGLPVRRCLDGIAPGVGLAVAIGRVGCFLQGCCFGLPTSVPWAVRFPAGSPAYESHRILGLIPADAATSLPVHPLELYFAAAGLGIALVLLRLLPRVRYDGQVVLALLALHSWSKFALEHLRGREFGAAPNRAGEVELLIAIGASLALAAIAVVRRRAQATPLAARPAVPS